MRWIILLLIIYTYSRWRFELFYRLPITVSSTIRTHLIQNLLLLVPGILLCLILTSINEVILLLGTRSRSSYVLIDFIGFILISRLCGRCTILDTEGLLILKLLHLTTWRNIIHGETLIKKIRKEMKLTWPSSSLVLRWPILRSWVWSILWLSSVCFKKFYCLGLSF